MCIRDRELGIDVIWVCPMYKSPNDDNGYDISCLLYTSDETPKGIPFYNYEL